MAQFLGYPPRAIHSSTNLTPSEALGDITAYLSAAVTDASLHPNALLTESGPVAVSSGESLGLALHNLQRLQKGLLGEHLVPERVLVEGVQETPSKRAKTGAETTAQAASAEEAEGRSGWQDRDEFEREQDVEQGHAEGTDAPVVREETGARPTERVAKPAKRKGAPVHSSTVVAAEHAPMDEQAEAERKALRKKMKKERKKEEQRSKAMKAKKAKKAKDGS